MSNENNPSANATATTSKTEPEKAAEREKASEADYITREQDRAKAAIGNVIGDMKQALAQGADVKEWTRLHPWVMVGGAAVAGLAAGLMLIPSKGATRKKNDPVYAFFGEHWDEIKHKLNELSPQGAAAAAAAATAATATASAAAEAKPVQPKQPSMIGNLVSEVLKVVGPTLGGLITGALAGAQQQEPPADGNGHAAAAVPQGYRTGETPPTV